MSYGNNPHTRIDRLETIVNEQIICCWETASEAEAEHNYDLLEQLSDRRDQLELRLERLAHISAACSADRIAELLKGTTP